MQEQLERFFNSINFTYDSEDFSDAIISKVVLNKKSEIFEVYIKSDKPINPVSSLSLIKASKNGIKGKGKCHINFVYEDISDDDILEAFKVLLGDLIIKRPSLVSLENKNIYIDDDFITIELDSKSEEYDILKKEIKGLSEALVEMGFYEMEITTAINVENEKRIQEEIEADKNREVEIEFYEPETNNSNGKWTPKKKVDLARGGLLSISSLEQEENNVHLEAYIFGSEFNELKTKDGRDLYLITLKISDNTSSILAKCFAKDKEDFINKSNELKDGKWFSFKGQVRYDTFAKDLVFNFRTYEELKDIPSFKRFDNEEVKRVELHAHTMMSQMDGVCDEVKLVKQAMEWGHPGIVITDHDCCQSFPHVFGEVTSFNKGLKKKAQAKIDDLKASLEEIKNSENPEGIEEMEKMIEDAEEEKKNLKFFKAGYGTELEICESYLNVCFNPNDEKIEDNTFVVFDTETTGFNPGLGDSMIEIGAVKIHHGEVIDRFDELINPGHHIDEEITRVTDISDDDVKDSDNEENVVKRFKEWIGNLPLVAHNAKFDKNMLDMAYYKYDLGKLENPIIDTLMLSRVINRDLKRHSLAALGKVYGIDTGEVDEDEEDVSSNVSNNKEIDSEVGNNFKSIKIDGEEVLDIVKEEYIDIDIATEDRVTKYRNRYYLKTIHKASKTESINIEIDVNDGIELIDFENKVELHPAENNIVIKYSDEFGDKELNLTVYVGQHHGADVDSENTGYIFNKMLSQIKGIEKLSDLNNLALLEETSFRNNPKYLDHIGDLISYKNYVFKPEENQVVDDSLGYPFEKYGNKEYRWKFPWCKEDNLQMYENIPSKTFSEHLANIYDGMKHITLIAKNKVGLKNLFRIVSFANTNFINRNARIPRKILEDNREGILVGSACLNGEIFNIALTRCDEDLIEAMKFYDYIEVQPPENYSHLLRGHDINNEEQLEDAIKKIIRCAKKCKKIVVATGDVHNINKEDRLYREIIVNQNVPGKGRHPLARYLNGYSKNNGNEDNYNKCINKALEQGIVFDYNTEKVLKYIFVLTKIKRIPINAINIENIYVPKGSNDDSYKALNEEERLQVISRSLRKLAVAEIIKEVDNNYVLNSEFNYNEPFKDGHIPNQFYRTTKEMKDEFSFLKDDELVDEIVVKNTNEILNELEDIEVVVYPDKPFSPVIEHSQETCRDLVFDKAHSMYGDPLPPNIEERIAQEFYGDKISDLVKNHIKSENPDMSDEDVDKIFIPKLHEVIMSGYDGVVNLKKGEVLRENPDLSDEEAIEKAKAELTGIIGGGFDVIYLIAQKLVKHSNDDGYLVGSRGSVGSSFVASMMGITECNGLPAHYYCPKCQHSEFNDEEGKALSENYPSGFDLPAKKCPECGADMIHQGNDMPFATFLGFAGEKVPDIDLNFSGDNQASAHDYTKVLFGTDNVYRAGTIGTVADKTAIGYVQGYYEEKLHDMLKIEAQSYGLDVAGKDELKKKGIIKSYIRFPEVERISVGCTGVKRTTGQHPGGIVVVPGYKDIWDFTPFQYPADDPTAAWRTTHFDYHAIDADLLKLDILGHDDPTVLRMLQELAKKYITHGEEFDVTAIDLGDPDTMKIFTGPEILGVDRYDLRGSTDKDGRKYCPTGTLGVPEFGTSFLLGMLEETKPTTFAELIKISGLSHGTDVWLGNARDLCTPDKDGKIQVPFKNVIGCRDDIMVNLIQWGLKPAKAFKIMEFVRKGKASKDPAAWEEHAKYMRENNIPEWYIESCRKIKYMFPKAHATAYVTSAFRIAWFKVHYPILYYCAYLSIRRDQFDIKSMIGGVDAIRNKIDEIDDKGSLATNKDLDTKETLLLCLEMCLRGFYFKNIDVDKSDGKKFVITEDEKGLIIPFRALDGLGDNVADAIVKARSTGPFISIEDLMTRGKINGTSIEKLRELGCLDNLSESNQLSLF
ncbi:MAG: PolC-type DNA polymerase III [Bacilli bacterium]|nr:PolC-type DNA polymerase III [Bacilli bacterium]